MYQSTQNGAVLEAQSEMAYAIKAQAQMQAASASSGIPQRQPDVPVAIERLSRLLDGLSGIANTLEERLAPVLRPEAPNEQNSLGTVKPIGTPLSGHIDYLCDQLESSMNTLGNVIHRLEI